MTVKLFQEKLKQKGDEMDDVEESVEILIQSVYASYNDSSKKSSNKLLNLNRAFCDEGAPRMYISLPMALYNAMPKSAELLETEKSLSSWKDVLSREWFPNSVSGSFQNIWDWFGCTVKLDVSLTADDLNNANHPYGAVFREVLKSDGGVNKGMHFVPLYLLEQAMSGNFYTLPASDLRWYIARCVLIVYDESGCDDAPLHDFPTRENQSKVTGARLKSGISEGAGARKKCATESYIERLGYAHVTTSTKKVSQKSRVGEIERAYRKLYVISTRTKMLQTSMWRNVVWRNLHYWYKRDETSKPP